MCPDNATAVGGAARARDELEILLERVRAPLREVFGRLEVVASEVIALRRAALAERGVFTVADLARIKPTVIEQATAQPAADGFGFLVAAGVLPDRDRHIEWWQRTGTGFAPLRLNLDPSSVDVYEYFEMEWFVAGRDHGRRAVFGPYVDYFGANRYVFTVTYPAIDETFLGVAGADLQVSRFEPLLLNALRGATHDAVLIGSKGRVIAANTSRWLVGSRLRKVPRTAEGEFIAVGEVGLDSDWVLALAADA